MADKLYYYKRSGGYLILKKPLPEPLPEGTTLSSEAEYEQHQEEIKVQPSSKMLLLAQINSLKKQLDNTDYQAIKYAEGWLSEQEYATIKAQRQAWRDQINELEAELEEESE